MLLLIWLTQWTLINTIRVSRFYRMIVLRQSWAILRRASATKRETCRLNSQIFATKLSNGLSSFWNFKHGSELAGHQLLIGEAQKTAERPEFVTISQHSSWFISIFLELSLQISLWNITSFWEFFLETYHGWVHIHYTVQKINKSLSFQSSIVLIDKCISSTSKIIQL